MAEVMSMIPEENGPGELNAEEQDSLQVGEELEAQHEQMLAGKYKNAQELESAYLELQKKLGADGDEPEEQVEDQQLEETDSDLFDRLWEGEINDNFSDDILEELSNADPTDLAQMHLDYRRQMEANTFEPMTEETATQLKDMVGGDGEYTNLLGWAKDNFSEQEIDMYDSIMESGNTQAAFFAVQALALRYQDSMGTEGELIQGRAASDSAEGFRSQAELVNAMNDPRYERDAAYRNDIMRKLELSDIDF
jgi:hypothetical protein|tara:strand:+ start:2317 stop:3069 length:753 start_codon:yes stop_codon:yes gene_type:complete